MASGLIRSANYQAVERAPLVGQYHDMRIAQVPPPSSGGIVMLEALNILEGFRFDPRQPAAYILLWKPCGRAYRDRAEYLGDADFVKVPLARLLSKQYAESLRTTISIDHATLSAELQPTGAQLKY
ncbi:MAG: gamma-glutamyltransferase [Gammaproteobacteria bacterium]